MFICFCTMNDDHGAERVEALSLDMSQVSHIIQLSPKVFEEMDNLRLLRFYFKDDWYKKPTKLHLPQQGLEYLPNTLRLLRWDLYPSPSLPLNFSLENLVHLKMHGSSLTQLWEGDIVHLVNLKVCDLRWSKELIKIMDFSGVPNLEELNIEGCSGLVEIHSSIQLCRKLIKISVSGCVNLCGFPSGLRFTSLEVIELGHCRRITQLPELPSTVKRLALERSGIKQRVERVEALSLNMSQVSRIIQLCPKVFEEMDNLRLLRFYCLDDNHIPTKNPTKLHLPQQGLEYLPNTLRLLHWDRYPSASLPSNFCPENMVYLEMPGSSLTQLWEGDNVLCRKLTKIIVSGCVNLCGFPSDLRLTSLE
ncbi:hypothetical protein Tsubulata_046871, partial [Turnera subulata]